MKNKAKIMRLAERALKRTKSYLENRADSADPDDNYQLDYVLVRKDMPSPDAVIAYAHFEDIVISFHPLKQGDQETAYADCAFSFDDALFSFLEKGYELAGMSLISHAAAWGEITENFGGDYFHCLVGLQRYLRYCKQEGITAELLKEECWYDGPDAMTLYDKSAAK